MTNDEFMKKYQEMCNLMCDLSSNNSEIGDWKVIKQYESQLLGIDLPYSVAEMEEYNKKRQAARDRISEIREELGI